MLTVLHGQERLVVHEPLERDRDRRLERVLLADHVLERLKCVVGYKREGQTHRTARQSMCPTERDEC